MVDKKQFNEPSTKPYTTQEVANLFGITARTVQMWADSGIINASKTPGGHRRISADEVERLSIRINNKSLGASNPRREIASDAPKVDKNFTILVVEDDADLRMLYHMEMEEWDPSFKLLIVNDGYEALLLAGAVVPEVIITDLHMPNLDGFHLIDVLSSNKNLENCKIVVVTGLSEEEIGKRYPFPDTVTVLEKPIPFTRLKQIVFDKAKKEMQG